MEAIVTKLFYYTGVFIWGVVTGCFFTCGCLTIYAYIKPLVRRVYKRTYIGQYQYYKKFKKAYYRYLLCDTINDCDLKKRLLKARSLQGNIYAQKIHKLIDERVVELRKLIPDA